MLEFVSWLKSWKYVNLCTSVVPVFSAMFSFKCSACTQAAIRLLQRIAKYQLYSNSHSLVNSKIQNFENYTQTAIHSLATNTKFSILFRKSHLFFHSKLKSLKLHPNYYFFWPRNTIFEDIAKRSFVFLLRTTKIEL